MNKKSIKKGDDDKQAVGILLEHGGKRVKDLRGAADAVKPLSMEIINSCLYR